MDCGKLRNRIDIYNAKPVVLETGETDYVYEKTKTIWANIKPTSGNVVECAGNTEKSVIMHKVTIRSSAAKYIKNDTYFIYKGKKMHVLYDYPIYNRGGWMEVFCRLEVE